MNTRPTLKSLAAELNVSVMTVSLALRNSKRISAKTKEQVRRLATQQGYRQNSFAASLVSMRHSTEQKFQGTVALLNCHSTAQDWKLSPTFCDINRGVRRRALELGYKINEFWLNDPEVSASRLREILLSRGIPGVILAFFDSNPKTLEKLRTFNLSDFACASMGRKIEELQISSITNDHFYTSFLATQKLVSLGYRRIGLILDDNVDTGIEHRFLGGFLSVQMSLPKTDRVQPLILSGSQVSRSAAQLAGWVKKHRLDAVLSFHYKLYTQLQAAGFEIPKKLGFACLDQLCPKENVSGIDQNSEHVGEGGMDIIVAAIHRNESGPQKLNKSLMVRGKWVDGWSTKPPA